MKHETIDCRRDTRRPTYITGTIQKAGMANPCWVRDISAGGALIFAEVPLDRNDRVILAVDDKSLAAYVRWVDYPLAGLQFEAGSMIRGGTASREGVATPGGRLRDKLTTSDEGLAGRVRRWFQGN